MSNNNLDHNQEEQDSLAKQIAKHKAKKLLRDKIGGIAKKGLKIGAKVAAKAALAAVKSVIAFILGLSAPVLAIIGGVILILITAFIATSFLFSSDDPNVFEGEPLAQELQLYIKNAADSTVDMKDPNQKHYRLDEKIIMAALQIYDSKKHGKTDKEIVDIMVDKLKPTVKFKDATIYQETSVTTCNEEGCSTTESREAVEVTLLESIEAWDRKMDITYEIVMTDWGENMESTEGDNTVSTKHRWETSMATNMEEYDYSLFDRMLNEAPFEYSTKDKKSIEAVYQVLGGEVYYTEWLTGDSIINGIGGDYGFDGTVTPGGMVPPEFMKHYLMGEKAFKVDWYYLAAIHYVETSFSQNLSVSSAGAQGHTQFMTCTWLGWSYQGCKGTNGNVSIPPSILHNPTMIKKHNGYGLDGNKNGKANPYEIEDAILSTAGYLSRSGFSKNIDKAIYNYNHADWYVEKVKKYAMLFKEQATYTPSEGDVGGLVPGGFMRPVPSEITSGYGYRELGGGSNHAGLDFGTGGNKQRPIVSSADGTVIKTVNSCDPWGGYYKNPCGGRFGNHVYIMHVVGGKNYTGVYAHMSKVGVSLNQKVKQGQYIGNMGHSGSSTGPHLHWEIHNGIRQGASTSIDPAKLIGK